MVVNEKKMVKSAYFPKKLEYPLKKKKSISAHHILCDFSVKLVNCDSP